jgi:HEAT repeat protein
LLDAIGAEEHAPLRAAEADALASYVDLVELEELSPALAERLVRTLKDLTESDPDELVRQRALEAVAVISDDADISAAVADMYAAGDSDSRASALRAMGRQATERWLTTVGAELSSPEPELRFEAARAAGGLADQRLAPALVDLVEDPDLEVQLAAVGALGAVGGQLAVNTLRRLTRSERPAIAEAATDALDEAELFSGRLTPSLDLLPEPE